MIQRIIGSSIVLLSILVAPYWVYIPVLCLAIIIFPFFWEGILFALLIDVLYGNGVGVLPSISQSAVLALVVIIILLPLRESLRSYV